MSESVHPPPGDRAAVRLIRAPKAGVITCTFLGPYLGSLEHWDKKRTLPCLGDECPPIRHHLRQVYYAYAPVEVWLGPAQAWAAAVFQLTSNLEELLRGRNLRGETWSFMRTREGDANSEVTGVFLDHQTLELIPREFDVKRILLRITKEDFPLLGIKNNTPERVAMPLNKRPGPIALLPTSGEVEPNHPSEEQLNRIRKMAQGNNGRSPK